MGEPRDRRCRVHPPVSRKIRVTQAVVEEEPPSVRDPEGTELLGLRAELAQERDHHLRTRADFENYKRRVERDRDLAARDAKRELLHALADLADGFDQALHHVEDSPGEVLAGLHGMQRRLRSLLEAQGVKSFESVGQPFDPTRHEAIATVPDGVSGTVFDEAGRGYLWNDVLLRPARVRVAE